MERPEQMALQTRQDYRLYLFSMLYFSVILAVLVLEVLGYVSGIRLN
jgi:hypothetical protein